MIAIEIDARQLAQLTKATANARKSLPKEISAAINATARRTNLGVQRQITKKTTIKAAVAKSKIKLVKQSSPSTLSAQVTLRPSSRMSLKEFGARQTKAGVSYKISKGGKRATAQSAFIQPAMGSHVFKRIGAKVKMGTGSYAGKMRQRVKRLEGPSPWGVFVKNKMSPAQVKDIEAELKKQIERRINLNVLRANGLVPS
jgi:hypothetical protein